MTAWSFASTTISLISVSKKLVRNNHTLWKEQVLVVLWGAQLTSFLNGTIKAPVEKINIKSEEEEVPNPAFVASKA
jgi:hypothetical protein